MRGSARCALLSFVALTAASPAVAGGYRARLDTRFQTLSFRGVALDSISLGDVVVRPDGSMWTPDGYAVHRAPGSSVGTFFRPGPTLEAAPIVTSASLATWSRSHPGLSLRGTARVGFDLAEQDAWPGLEQAFELVEGYAEWLRGRGSARAGRLLETSRLGFRTYDGAEGELRLLRRRLRLRGYGGWGLARSSVLPATDPAQDPLEDFRPLRRQLLAGAMVDWSSARWQAVSLYEREVDPRADDFVSERVGVETALQFPAGIGISAGSDWDLAQGWWGSGEASVSWARPGRWRGATLGARRYRPHFELWTIWGAFSPIPYRAAFVESEAVGLSGVALRARGEVYEYDDPGASAPLARTEDDGWRWSAGTTVTRWSRWTAGAALHQEHGPGASSLGGDGSLSFEARRRLHVTAHASFVKRPLEFRFDEAELRTLGVSLDWERRGQRLAVDVRHLEESRERPDAAAFEWSQIRLGLGATFAFGSEDLAVPPAVLRIPRVGGVR